jgi:hypothetical protein
LGIGDFGLGIEETGGWRLETEGKTDEERFLKPKAYSLKPTA